MAEPTTSGTRIGEYRDGYYWNGTSWDKGETVDGTNALAGTWMWPGRSSSSTVPKSATAEELFAKRKAEDAKSVPETPPSSAAKRASILATIMRIESGGRNVPQAIEDENTRKGTPAQGYFQIINPTWNRYGGDKNGYKSAIDAPYATQLQIAQNIPVEQWGPATQQALRAAGYDFKPGETLGQLLARYGEDPNATRPEDVGGSSGGGAAVAGAAPTPPTSPLLGGGGGNRSDVIAGLLAKQQEDKQAAGYQGLTKQGLGLLGEGAPQQSQQPQVPQHLGGGYQMQPIQVAGMPSLNDSFTQQLALQRLLRRS